MLAYRVVAADGGSLFKARARVHHHVGDTIDHPRGVWCHPTLLGAASMAQLSPTTRILVLEYDKEGQRPHNHPRETVVSKGSVVGEIPRAEFDTAYLEHLRENMPRKYESELWLRGRNTPGGGV